MPVRRRWVGSGKGTECDDNAEVETSDVSAGNDCGDGKVFVETKTNEAGQRDGYKPDQDGGTLACRTTGRPLLAVASQAIWG